MTRPYLELIGVFSLFTFIATLLFIPWLVARLPEDYFIRYLSSLHQPTKKLHPGTLIILTLRNMVGLVLLLAGVAMLFLPGQGVLTIVIALTLMAFPGKHALIERILQIPSVPRSLNWIRTKTNRPQFIWLDPKE